MPKDDRFKDFTEEEELAFRYHYGLLEHRKHAIITLLASFNTSLLSDISIHTSLSKLFPLESSMQNRYVKEKLWWLSVRIKLEEKGITKKGKHV